MIISVSRRTDIPAYFSDWFFNRLKEGYVLTPNPFNNNMVHKTSLRKEDVTCFVFWTKNPKNIMKRLDELNGFNYYFQYTLTSYQKDIEQNVLEIDERIDTFIELSKRIGKEKVIWRYDPILLNDKYTKEYHYKWFEKFCSKLHPYTAKCIVSFIDIYKNTKRNLSLLNLKMLDKDDIEEIALNYSDIASRYNLKLETCSEEIDLDTYNIKHGKCIDDDLIREITKDNNINFKKDKYQRRECGCISSVDIGIYNTCLHNCLYCYANYSFHTISDNVEKHNKNSPILIGEVKDSMKIFERKLI